MKRGYSNSSFLNQFSQDKEWTLSMYNVHGFSGHCPVCLDIVQGISGQCPHLPLSPWTLSRESMDIVPGDTGQCPLSPWTLSSLSGLPGLCPEYPWTLSRLSTDSMDCPGSPWTLSRETMDSVDILLFSLDCTHLVLILYGVVSVFIVFSLSLQFSWQKVSLPPVALVTFFI